MTDASQVFVVDADGHVIEPPGIWERYLEPRFRSRAPRPCFDENGTFCYAVGDALIMRTASRLGTLLERRAEGQSHAAIRPGGGDPGARLVDMDAEGIDISVLYPSAAFFFAEVGDTELHAALCRAYNDWLADYCRTDAERLVGIALLPLDDVSASIQELERCTSELGFRGAFFRPNPYAGRPIQHPAYEPFWACAESLGVPVTVHEGISDSLPTLGRDRSQSPVVQHLMSHPFEQMAASAGLITGGVLERHPGLRFVFLESGCGWLPYWLERMDEHYENYRHHLRGMKRPATEYFQRQCFISMDPDDGSAPHVIDRVGDDCLVWASDYPHPDHSFPGTVKATLEVLSHVPESSLRKVLATNALRLYDMEPPERARNPGGAAG